jgi:hypothetical protein
MRECMVIVVCNSITNLGKKFELFGAYPSQLFLKTLEYVDKHSWKMYNKSCYNSIADLLKIYDYC